MYGRPLRVGDAPVIAAGEAGASDWTAELAVRAAALSPGLRAALTERWTRAALDEHASVAAFSKIALDLLRFDAPPELVAAAHEAALDEIRHANHGFAVASAIAGAPVRPGRFPLAASLPLAADLAAVAAEAARDGCIGETVAALLARAAAERCDDPAIRAVLLGIAEDEERHAILGWRTADSYSFFLARNHSRSLLRARRRRNAVVSAGNDGACGRGMPRIITTAVMVWGGRSTCIISMSLAPLSRHLGGVAREHDGNR